MNTNQPLVSIVICTFNGERYLSNTIDSVLTQTYKNIEIIIVDDGSVDNTYSILQHYMSLDDRIRVFSRTNAGLAASRNFAFSQSLGDWIAIIDQDDLCYPDRIMTQIQVADQYPSAGLIFSNTDYINEEGVKIGSHLKSFCLPDFFIPKGIAASLLLSQGCYVDSEACFINRGIVKIIGPFKESLRYACDYEYFIRAGLLTDFAFTKNTLSAWRIHADQETRKNINRFWEYRTILKEYFFGKSFNSKIKFLIFTRYLRSIMIEVYSRMHNFSSTS